MVLWDFLKDLKCLISSESRSGKPFRPQPAGNQDRFLPITTLSSSYIISSCQNDHFLWKYIIFNIRSKQDNQARFSVHRIFLPKSNVNSLGIFFTYKLPHKVWCIECITEIAPVLMDLIFDYLIFSLCALIFIRHMN